MTRRSRRVAEPGQATIEVALMMPFLLLFGLVCTQFAVILLAYMSVVGATRDVARWVSVHPHTLDSAAISQVRTRLPSNLTSARLTIAISPACTSLTDGKCTARPPGTRMTTTLTYSIADILFLPASIQIGSLSASIPQTLPAYSMYIQVEPS